MAGMHYRCSRVKKPLNPFVVVLLLYSIPACTQPVPVKIAHPDHCPATVSEMLFTLHVTSIPLEEIDVLPLNKQPRWSHINWNWFIYIGILLVVLYIIRTYELSRMRLRNQMRIANIKTEKLKEIDLLKSKFYANISHEFRTPLTLIRGPLEQLIEVCTDPYTNNIYKTMHANASSLLELISQLLDLSKIESGNYSLKAYQGDLGNFIEGLAQSYSSLADQKSMTLEVKVSPELLENEVRNNIYFDPDILDKIVNNLISNAFKWTPVKGNITVSLDLAREDQKIKFLEIRVEDTGVGIESDHLPFIFDRFYQADRAPVPGYEGTGVGLSIVSELVRVHKGEIDVQSTPDKGTVFRVRIPYGKQHLTPDEIGDAELLEKPGTPPLQLIIPEEKVDPRSKIRDSNSKKPWVLVVEDHAQVRRYIIDSIHNNYRILQAANAPDGFEMAQESIPDLIISDIMMPGIDGFKLCEQLKNSEKTSHIPIILLTARADITDRITGLKWGADDYLTKPFNAEELRTRIGNLIDNRNVLRKKFSSNSIIRPAEISVSPHDASFIETLLGLVEKNMENTQYSVEALAKDVRLSQSQLHRKLKAIINMSAIQFITSVRMHRAMELLNKHAGNIAEIAYMVGYDDPGYFSKTFRKFFNKLPSEVIRK